MDILLSPVSALMLILPAKMKKDPIHIIVMIQNYAFATMDI